MNLGAYRITPKGAKRVWALPDEPRFLIPTWSDTVARPRIVIRNGLVYHATQGRINRRIDALSLPMKTPAKSWPISRATTTSGFR
jgi:hypothetical protein